MKKAFLWLLVCAGMAWGDFPDDVEVSDVEVFSGHPWKEVVVGYTIKQSSPLADAIRLTATDRSANKTYSTLVTNVELTPGRHSLCWHPAKFSSTNVVFTVSVVSLEGVQLWKDGPYWAECNVGATKPEEYGYYFWWGNTVGYKRNALNNGWISVADGGSFTFSRDNGHSHIYLGGIDAAPQYQYLSAPWRMPTDAEWSALFSNCTTTWTTRNGVRGRLVRGKEGVYKSNSIFLPAAGCGNGSSLDNPGSHGYYWSSTLSVGTFWDPGLNKEFYQASTAWSALFYSDYVGRHKNDLYLGLSVRPVR